MSGWTPGPWVYYVDAPSIDPTWHIVTTADKMRVIANVHIEPGNVVDEANARLIAAAPDLAEALAEWISADDEWYESLNCDAGGAERRLDKAKDAARAALRRAKGEA